MDNIKINLSVEGKKNDVFKLLYILAIIKQYGISSSTGEIKLQIDGKQSKLDILINDIPIQIPENLKKEIEEGKSSFDIKFI